MYGIDCPGCGLQRAIILLLKGEFWASLNMYPPLLPLLGTLGLFFLNKQIYYVHQQFIFKATAWSLAILVSVNFLMKLCWKLIYT